MIRAKRKATKPRRRRNSAATRQDLVAATLSLMAEGGEQAVTVAEAAKRVGITRRAAYHHFKTREELLAALRRWMEHKLVSVTEGAADIGDPLWLLASLAAEDERVIRSRLYEALEQGSRKNRLLSRLIKQFHRFAEERRLRKGTDPEMAALIAFSSWFGAVMATSRAKSMTQKLARARAYRDALEQSLLYGLFDPKSFPLPFHRPASR